MTHNTTPSYKKVDQRSPCDPKATPKEEPMSGLEAFREMRKMAESGNFPEMTLEEINEEIRQAREERSM